MRGKNPYELRFDIFHTAQSRAEQKFAEDLTDYRIYQDQIFEGKEEKNPLERPSYPTLEEVFGEAQKIKEFVENKE